MLVRKGRLKLTMDPEDWVAKSEALPFLRFIPIDNRILLKSVHLPYYAHPDPADRIIIATALNFGARLVTKDQRILDYPYVETVW